MKIKNKGKVHPSPSSSSSSSSSSDGDFFEVFNYLPVAILALISVLTLDDREVLAFMMRRSMETSSSSSFVSGNKFSKRAPKKSTVPRASSGSACVHSPPSFTCFDCYMSFWDRWNSSPNGELIHQAIEAFEEQLANGEKSSKNVKGKKREKIGRQSSDKPVNVVAPPLPPLPEVLPLPNDEGSSAAPTTSGSDDVEAAEGKGEPSRTEDETAVMIVPSPPPSNRKGLARKVWPDVLGLFNSRLWSLWGPH
ncbi:uncharacterized protein LOC111806103 [Cucurbita pepo subsp. pepo]|uniref:uncharacterized protein LOC111806103 n=1 Tax=Cucurbita pepo subsp. pepo TaxID=3664 RepID=UPI000C9D5BF1|nr:uncharacterized protein LOC111806103 [Cucurbita pepo subsp. pepo]